MELSRLINSINEPQTIMMAKLSRTLKAQGIEVIDLSLGEPDFDTPQHIKDAAVRALTEGWTKYPPVAGYPDLREAVCTKLKRDNDLEYTPAQIVVSTGAKQSLSNVFSVLIDPEDEVIIPVPYWVTYATQVQLCGGRCVFIPTSIEQGYKISPEQLRAAITPKTKAIVYSSPCNPSGSVYSQEELAALKDVLLDHPQVVVISDEIYEFINYSGKHASMAHFPEMKDRTVIVNGFSKGYAMTGWRLGYIAAPEEIAKACEKMQSQTTSGTNSIAQKAGVEALTGTHEPVQLMLDQYQARKKFFIKAISEIPGFKVQEPEGAFYAYADISAFLGKNLNGKVINNSTDFAMYLLEEVHVTGVPGIAFGDDRCIRFSFATSMNNLEIAIERLQKAFATTTA